MAVHHGITVTLDNSGELELLLEVASRRALRPSAFLRLKLPMDEVRRGPSFPRGRRSPTRCSAQCGSPCWRRPRRRCTAPWARQPASFCAAITTTSATSSTAPTTTPPRCAIWSTPWPACAPRPASSPACSISAAAGRTRPTPSPANEPPARGGAAGGVRRGPARGPRRRAGRRRPAAPAHHLRARTLARGRVHRAPRSRPVGQGAVRLPLRRYRRPEAPAAARLHRGLQVPLGQSGRPRGTRRPGPPKLFGPTCTNDELAVGYDFPSVARGDVVAALACGAYAQTFNASLNSMARPAVVLVNGREAAVAVRRERVDDVLGRYELPSWLREASPPRAD